MTEQTRRNVLRYGIAIDLVIVASGVGMLMPMPPAALALLYAAVVALSAWRGGWKGAMVAFVAAAVVLVAGFPESVTASSMALFAGASLVAGGAVAMLARPRPATEAESVSASEPVAEEQVAQPGPEVPAAPGDFAHQLLEPDALAEVVPLHDESEEEQKPRGSRRKGKKRRGSLKAVPAETAEPEASAAIAAAAEQERQEALRLAAEAEAERLRAEEERARAARELEQQLEQRLAAEREAVRREAEARAEAERRAIEEERQRIERELQERIARERDEKERELREQLDAEKRAAEEELRQRLEAEREAMRLQAEQELAAERQRLAEETERLRAATVPRPEPIRPPALVSGRRAVRPSLLDTVSGWFRRSPAPTVNVQKRVNGVANPVKRASATTRPVAPPRRTTTASDKPRLLMIERRRATADTVVPRLRDRSIDVVVVERWVDAVDELFRLKPSAVLLDTEHPDFEVMHRTLIEKSPRLPIVLTSKMAGAVPAVRHAATLVRPYDGDELARLANRAAATPEEMLALQNAPRTSAAPAAAAAAPSPRATSAAKPRTAESAALAPAPPPPSTPATVASNPNSYEVMCFTCRSPFEAMSADWCSCLAKERTLVCTNCLACFCKAPPAYKEKFWVEAPPPLFERKTNDARRQEAGLPQNPPASAVRRPLVLTVEDDEEIQAIVQRVCLNLGYGFIWATNGQDGMNLAREYKPDLILSDAFMPKLDGREMCRMLKELPEHADCRMIVMTGLYTDTKYRSEAVKRFHVDDYVAKPVAITELINLLQKHLEGVTGLPAQEDLHELHRAPIDEEAEVVGEDEVTLADVLAGEPASEPKLSVAARPASEDYAVCCYNCQNMFDATRAEWCSCVGRDNTLVCEHCGGCFCKAPAAYRERFWIDAPPSLFERKMIGSKRNIVARHNPAPAEVKRPLILLVEDDENVQLIVRTVVSSMGYGFVVGANGQEGLSLAREYNPDLILSDAFMPKLDGREMCRLLKEDASTARAKAIIMTGLYTDRKYRNEALDYFKVDDYVAKPLAVDDLIKLFKKHLPYEVATTH